MKDYSHLINKTIDKNLLTTSIFKDQLSSLINTLNKTKPRYIRCIKNNNYKKG